MWSETKLSDKLWVSLNACVASENKEKLEGLVIFYRKNNSKCRVLEGLLYILKKFLASYNGSKAFGYLSYDDIPGIFCCFMERFAHNKEFM